MFGRVGFDRVVEEPFLFIHELDPEFPPQPGVKVVLPIPLGTGLGDVAGLPKSDSRLGGVSPRSVPRLRVWTDEERECAGEGGRGVEEGGDEGGGEGEGYFAGEGADEVEVAASGERWISVGREWSD